MQRQALSRNTGQTNILSIQQLHAQLLSVDIVMLERTKMRSTLVALHATIFWARLLQICLR